MNDPYPLEKTLWTSDDFEVMGWHDVRVWAMAASEEDCRASAACKAAGDCSLSGTRCVEAR